jgi:hypothetical protein
VATAAEDDDEDVSMVRARADEAAAGAEDTVTGIEKERDSDDGGNASFPAEAAAEAAASFVDPAAAAAASEDDCSNAGTVERSVAVSGRRPCHANDGVRSIRDERTPERVRTENVGGNDEKAAVDDIADDVDDDEKENAELFAALWRGVDDRV